jgi:hypothetical protein
MHSTGTEHKKSKFIAIPASCSRKVAKSPTLESSQLAPEWGHPVHTAALAKNQCVHPPPFTSPPTNPTLPPCPILFTHSPHVLMAKIDSGACARPGWWLYLHRHDCTQLHTRTRKALAGVVVTSRHAFLNPPTPNPSSACVISHVLFVRPRECVGSCEVLANNTCVGPTKPLSGAWQEMRCRVTATLIEHPVRPPTPHTLHTPHHNAQRRPRPFPPLAPYTGTVGSIDKSQDGKIFVEKYDAKTQKTPITIPVSACWCWSVAHCIRLMVMTQKTPITIPVRVGLLHTAVA